jgi:hypothetical protein
MKMKEKIFNVGFNQFIKSPFSVILFLAIIGLAWLGKYLIDSKEAEILTQQERIKDCDEERKRDKQLLQDLIFENRRKNVLEDK